MFDGLRVSYLKLAGGPRLVRLEEALGEYLESDEGTDAVGTAAVLEYLDVCRQHAYFDASRDVGCPQWFEAAVWPCFVESICDGTRARITLALTSSCWFANCDSRTLLCSAGGRGR